jgi:hypothetical protein
MADGGNMIIGRNNDESMPTIIVRHGMGVVADALMVSNDTFGNAIRTGTAIGTGVDATTLSGVGLNASASSGTAITASTINGLVIQATSTSGRAMLAQCPMGILSTANTIAISGESQTAMGVLGITHAPVAPFGQAPGGVGGWADNGSGVVGASNVGDGVDGFSDQSNGVFGDSNSGCGVFGSCQDGTGVAGESMTSTGVYGRSSSGFAGVFDGPVVVNGSFTVTGQPKSSAVKHPDGSLRRLYCMESTESWFEDFGEARLVRGAAKVKLDSQFAAIIDTRQYHVFLTCNGPANVYIAKKGPNSFEVSSIEASSDQNRRHRSGSLSFAYRIVGRRKGWTGKRLERVQISNLMHPKLSKPKTSLAGVRAMVHDQTKETEREIARLKGSGKQQARKSRTGRKVSGPRI